VKSLAIITARGGSKRIPKKNIREFCGKPIIAYSIEAAIKSGLFDEVMVSTDSEEIAEVARQNGAVVPFMRSTETSDDYATTADVLNEVLSEYKKQGKQFEWMCCIYPTAPFVTAEKLKKAWAYLWEKHGDALVTVVAFSFPPQRCVVIRDGKLEYKWPENVRKRSQDLETYYHDAGQFYFWKVKGFADGIGVNVVPFILPEQEVQDIDNLSDWEIAEIKYRLMIQK
jgi:N-acylneuraminate cytidylyltransferase